MQTSTSQVMDQAIDTKSLVRTIRNGKLPEQQHLSIKIKTPHIAPYSNKWSGRAAASFALVEIDDKSPEGKLIIKVRRELFRHIKRKPGPRPTPCLPRRR